MKQRRRRMSTTSTTEEWTVVTAADKKRVMRKRSGRARRRTDHCAAVVVEGSKIQDFGLLQRFLEECIDYLLSTTFWKRLIASFDTQAIGDEIQLIVCYGIGNFSQTGTTYFSAPLWQLACVVALQRHLNLEQQQTRFFDPCSTDCENQFVAEILMMEVLHQNDRGNHPVLGRAGATLFFMPHCPALMYENVVWSNYYSKNIWILGNSLNRIAETNGDCLCLRCVVEYWENQNLKKNETSICMEPAKQECDEAPGNLLGAFNDTFLSRIGTPRDDWPPRPYDRLLSHPEQGELL